MINGVRGFISCLVEISCYPGPVEVLLTNTGIREIRPTHGGPCVQAYFNKTFTGRERAAKLTSGKDLFKFPEINQAGEVRTAHSCGRI